MIGLYLTSGIIFLDTWRIRVDRLVRQRLEELKAQALEIQTSLSSLSEHVISCLLLAQQTFNILQSISRLQLEKSQQQSSKSSSISSMKSNSQKELESSGESAKSEIIRDPTLKTVWENLK